MEQQNYINERMKELSMNIDEFSLGQIIEDIDKSHCEITNKTLNSIEVSIKRKTDKGIDCRQWFDMKEFNKRFKVLNRK
jgi:hypothetical protein